MDSAVVDAVTKLIGALAVTAWPALVFFVIWSYRAQVASLIESAKNRKFTVEVGGQKLTMKEANHQQQGFIDDLQKQVNALREQMADGAARMDAGGVPAPVAPNIPPLMIPAASNAILWADDTPKNNSYFIQLLQERGYKVDLAQSTAEAESLLSKTNYRLVLSDMGRTENGVYKETAGIDLLIAVRGNKSNVPYVIYCSPSGAKKFGRRAEGEGGRITSSPTILRGVLDELAPDTSKQEI